MPTQIFDNVIVNGKLGIGVNDPTYPLHIASSTDAPSQALLESGGAQLKLSVNSTGGTFGTDNAFPLSIQTNNISRLSINSAGDVEIPGLLAVGGLQARNATFTEPLTVQSTLTVTGNLTIASGNLQAENATFSGPLTVQNTLSVSGNVGIGTAPSADARLNVNGAVRATTFQGNGAALTNVQVPDGSITTSKISDNAINANKVANQAIAKRHLQNRAVAIPQLSTTLVFDGQVALTGEVTYVTVESTPPGVHRFYFVSLSCLSITLSNRPLGSGFPIYFSTFSWSHAVFASPTQLISGQPVPVGNNIQQIMIRNNRSPSGVTVACKVYRLDET